MNARLNPFRTECVLRVRYRFEGTSLEALLAQCEQPGFRGAIIGPCGSGKTTLLEDLGLALRERGLIAPLIRLDAERRTFDRGVLDNLAETLGRNHVLLFDGAEQLSWPGWVRFRWCTRRVRGLLITTHRQGRMPALWQCRTSPELLAGIAAELLGCAGSATATQAYSLHREHKGNLRDALRSWYDIYAGLVSV